MTTDTKSCPLCSETIKTIAKKCRYCGEFLDGHTRESILANLTKSRNQILKAECISGPIIQTGDGNQVLIAKNIAGSVVQIGKSND